MQQGPNPASNLKRTTYAQLAGKAVLLLLQDSEYFRQVESWSDCVQNQILAYVCSPDGCLPWEKAFSVPEASPSQF